MGLGVVPGQTALADWRVLRPAPNDEHEPHASARARARARVSPHRTHNTHSQTHVRVESSGDADAASERRAGGLTPRRRPSADKPRSEDEGRAGREDGEGPAMAFVLREASWRQSGLQGSRGPGRAPRRAICASTNNMDVGKALCDHRLLVSLASTARSRQARLQRGSEHEVEPRALPFRLLARRSARLAHGIAH